MMKRLLMFAGLTMVLAVAASPAWAYTRVVMIRGRGAMVRMPVAGHGGTSVGLVIAGVAILAVVIGGIVYASIADRRRSAPAPAAGEPTPLPGHRTEPEQKHKAA
jgi:hypothetical protein